MVVDLTAPPSTDLVATSTEHELATVTHAHGSGADDDAEARIGTVEAVLLAA